MGTETNSHNKASRLKRTVSELPEIKFAGIIFIIILAVIFCLDFFIKNKNGFIGNLIGEVHGLTFDILVFGILIVIFNKFADKRRDIKEMAGRN